MPSWMAVSHKPAWSPTRLRYNYEGDTRPGYECLHELENGNGPCGSNVFELSQEVGRHICFVVKKDWRQKNPLRRMRLAYRRKKR